MLTIHKLDLQQCTEDLAELGRLSSQYQLIERQTRIHLNITATLDYDLATIFDIHRELVEAISGGNAEAAEYLARNHKTADGERMVAILEVEGENAG